MAPLIKHALVISAFLVVAACGDKGGKDSAAAPGPGPQIPAPVEQKKLQLKNAGTKKVLIGSIVDLRVYLENYAAATYEVIEGQSQVEWADPNRPKLHFKQGGKVTVLVVDAKDQTAVALKIQVVFDTTEITDPVDPIELPEIPVLPIIRP